MTNSSSGPGGLAATCAAFAIWGLFPLYLRALDAVPPLQLVAHRVAWACVLLFGVIAVRREFAGLRQALARPGVALRLAATAVLISINWLAYVWAVANDRVVETSLGYFINPLVNVVLGVVLLAERLNRTQWVAVAIAALGVLWLTLTAGHPPWIALALAFSFGLYGFMRKTAQVEALPGLAIETAMLAPLATGYLLWCGLQGTSAMGAGSGAGINALLAGSGLVTAVPLLLFAHGARRLPYSTVGLLQYIAPTLQLGCALLVFHEPFDRTRAVGFALIWVALALCAWDGMWRARQPVSA